MVRLTQLPAEILHNILQFLDPSDLFVVPKTCHFFYEVIKDNKVLHRDIYYRDEPPTTDLDWVQEIHDYARLQAICSRHGVDRRSEFVFVFTTATRILRNASQPTDLDRAAISVTYPESRNVAFLARLFGNDCTREAFLHRSVLFNPVWEALG